MILFGIDIGADTVVTGFTKYGAEVFCKVYKSERGVRNAVKRLRKNKEISVIKVELEGGLNAKEKEV